MCHVGRGFCRRLGCPTSRARFTGALVRPARHRRATKIWTTGAPPPQPARRACARRQPRTHAHACTPRSLARYYDVFDMALRFFCARSSRLPVLLARAAMRAGALSRFSGPCCLLNPRASTATAPTPIWSQLETYAERRPSAFQRPGGVGALHVPFGVDPAQEGARGFVRFADETDPPLQSQQAGPRVPPHLRSPGSFFPKSSVTWAAASG